MKKSYTLAEVLITIGVIGLIASLTIPVLNKATQDVEKNAKVKKAYSTLYNATNEIMQENGGDMRMSVDGLVGNVNNDLITISTFYKNQYKNHIKTMSDCDTKELCQGKLWPINTEWYYYDSSPISEQAGGFSGYAIILSPDGTTYRFYIYRNNCDYDSLTTCGTIMFDINGMKKPNKMGDDIYELRLLRQKLIPNSPQLTTILQNK